MHPPLFKTHLLAFSPQPYKMDLDTRSTLSQKYPLLDINLSTGIKGLLF